ncbi:MAG TPA: hypothetical protein VIK91_19065, partial [Nannocystis sp.]
MSVLILVAPLAPAACGGAGSGSSETAAGSSSTATEGTGTGTASTGSSEPTSDGSSSGGGTQSGTGSTTGSPTSSGGETGEPSTTEAVTSTETGDSSTTEAPSTTGDSSTTEDSSTTSTTTDPGTTGDVSSTSTTGVGTTTGGNGLWYKPNLWYSVHESIMYIEIDPQDGSVVKLVHNQLLSDVPLHHGQNGLTMLEDGSLLGSRESAQGTQIYHVADPPTTEDTPAMAVVLGIVPTDGDMPLRIEALYTDCVGRVYLMDTGVDVTNSIGNRLLRFTGNYLQGDLNFEVITDLENASVGDIDDMSPGIVNGEISDSLGFAMDSSNLWHLDYTTGTGVKLGKTGGTYGVHALGGPLFADGVPRLYVLSAGNADKGAELLLVDLDDYSNGPPLVVGPDLD